MFSLLTGVYDSYLAPSQLNLLVVGAPSVGKTALLERLKVTQIPKRSSSKPVMSPAVLTPSLQEAFCETGVGGSPSVGPDTVSETTGSETDSTSVQKPVLANPPKPAPGPVVVQKRRFHFSICPAPERYSRSLEDQDEDFVIEEPSQQAPTTVPSSSDHATQENGIETDINTEDEEKLPLELPSTSEAPRMVRCHSKEFTVQELDILNSATTNDQQARTVSMESIPIDEAPNLPSLRQNPSVEKESAPLLQKEFEEHNVKPKAKMLPLSKIRPTSKCVMYIHLEVLLAITHCVHSFCIRSSRNKSWQN